MNRKKLYNDVTGWTGWFFCEMAFKVFPLSDVNGFWNDKTDTWAWWFCPIGWFADRSYDIGCRFYDLEKD